MIYVYECPRCAVTTEQQRKLEERDEPVECVECHATMTRVPTAPAPTFPGADSWRGR